MVIEGKTMKRIKMLLPNSLFVKDGLRVVVTPYSTLQDELWLVS